MWADSRRRGTARAVALEDPRPSQAVDAEAAHRRAPRPGRRWQTSVLFAVLFLDLVVLWAVVDKGVVSGELGELRAMADAIQARWESAAPGAIAMAPGSMSNGPLRRPPRQSRWSMGLPLGASVATRRMPIPYMRLPRQRVKAASPDGLTRPEAFVTGPERCFRYRGRSFCDGPRRVPAAYRDEDAEHLAAALGLGKWDVGAKLLRSRARKSWRDQTQGDAVDGLLWPVPIRRIGRGFGQVRNESDRLHPGLDLPAAIGDHVLAVASGMVAYADNGIRGYGNTVMIVHPGRAVSVYAHLSELWVLPGERVRAGQTLALAGDTGLARGPHLHFEWRVDGDPIDPAPLFRAPKR